MKIRKTIPYIINIILVIAMFSSMIDKSIIVGDSMKPLLTSGQTVWGIKTDKYEYGDIVIIEDKDNENKDKMVKRIYGQPKDNIKIDNGNISINNELVKVVNNITDKDEYTLSEDEYLVIGDNPNTIYLKINKRDIISRVEGVVR